MYIPDAFAVTAPAEIDDLLQQAPFGALVTTGAGGLVATHLPFLHDREAGVLSGHLARANPHRAAAGDGAALVIFQGASGYVSPGWYPSKAIDARVVPTWNYEAVHVYGHLTWRDDPAWLLANVAALSARFEADQSQPWSLQDAPADHIDRLLRGVVGVQVQITRIEAKRKLSQNKLDADRRGVIAGLEASDRAGERELARRMAGLFTDPER